MKKELYIFLSVILGFLVSVIIHAAIEIPVLMLFIDDFEKYGMGLDWSFWFAVHHILSVFLAVAGIGGGYLLGRKWYENGIK